MNYKYILFDLDGTVTDSASGIYASVDYALSHDGRTENDPERKRSIIGPPLRVSFSKLWGYTDDKLETMIGYYREHYNEYGWKDNKLYDGIADTILELHNRGKVLVLATSKPKHFAEKIIEYFGLMPYFSYISAATFGENSGDKQEIILEGLKAVGAKPEEALMIGDTKYDIIGAVGAKVDSIGVTYGFGDEQEMRELGATYIVDTPQEILSIAK